MPGKVFCVGPGAVAAPIMPVRFDPPLGLG